MKPKSMKGLTGGWSKYGGRRFDALDSQNEEKRDYWYCQTCGQIQPRELSAYKKQLPDGDYIRVCAGCMGTGYVEKKIASIVELAEIEQNEHKTYYMKISRLVIKKKTRT